MKTIRKQSSIYLFLFTYRVFMKDKKNLCKSLGLNKSILNECCGSTVPNLSLKIETECFYLIHYENICKQSYIFSFFLYKKSKVKIFSILQCSDINLFGLMLWHHNLLFGIKKGKTVY
jgi:hypothetical protein